MSANKATGSVPYNPKEETHHAHGKRFSKPCRSRRNVCFQRSGASRAKIIAASVISSVITLQLGSLSVAIETTLSGITELPFGIFAVTMQAIHLAIGTVEGLITACVLIFIYNARPELIDESSANMQARFSYKKTLAVKGAFAVLASYQLIAATAMEHICAALRMLRIPQFLVTQLLLIYRYLTLLLKQADEIAQAYSLRAPQQNGLHISVWGSLVGQLLLRSLERAGAMYDSMLLRGFHGEYYYAAPTQQEKFNSAA